MTRTSIAGRLPVLLLVAGLFLAGEGKSEIPPGAQAAWALLNAGKFAEAEAAARAELSKLEADGQGDSFDASHYLNLIAETMRLQGHARDPEAAAVAERSVAIRERLRGPDDADVALSLQSLAANRLDNGRYAEARELYDRVLAIQEKNFGSRSPQVARVLHSTAMTINAQGNYEGAREKYERALAIYEALPDPPKADMAKTLNNLGNVLQKLGDLSGAIAIHERALATRKEVLGPRHPDVATSLNNLGSVWDDLGQTVRARELYEQALALREEVLGRDHPAVASTLNNLAILLASVGDYDSARPLYERALAIREKTFGPDHQLVAEVLVNLAGTLWKSGDLKGARELYERGLAVFEKAVGPDHPSVAETLEGLAFMAEEEGDLERSKSLHERALRIREKVFGPESYAMAEDLEGLSSLAARAGDGAEATRLTERVLALRRKVLGTDHPLVAQSLRDLARLQWSAGSGGSAFDTALEAERMAREQFRQVAAGLAEREALLYEAVRISGLDLAASVLASSPASSLPPDSSSRFADEVIRSRALVLDEMAERRSAIAAGATTETASLREALSRNRILLASLVVRGPDPSRPGDYARKVRDASGEKEKAERDLAARSLRFRDHLERVQIGLKEIRESLPRGAALVSYLQYAAVSPPAEKPAAPGKGPPPVASYLALILRTDRREPYVVRLGTREKIDGLISSWKAAASSDPSGLPDSSQGESGYRESGDRLRRAIWDPVAARLGKARTVFIVPDGAVNLVSFSALPDSNRGYLIESGPTTQYLSAERDLKVPVHPAGEGKGLLLVGGPDFDAAAALGPEAAPAAGPQGAPGFASGATRLRAASCGDLMSMRFDPLPGTEIETEKVESIWSRAHGNGGAGSDSVTRLTGSRADEGTFKQMAPRQRILHLATHGFFLQGRCGSSLEQARSGARAAETRITSVLPTGESPLLLSGLAFAGANRRAETPPDSTLEDGVLTAEEIAGLDLSGVEWVVLSACDTGAGEVRAGEGVLGMRRAFETAGAGTLILSLWPVEDRAAVEWMTHLYTARLRGLSTAESVRMAALETLRARREKGRSTHPFYWGSFVAAGDWR